MKVEFSPVKEELLPESLPNMEGELDPPINMKVDEDLDIPHVIVKLEEETATETEVDMSAFAPVESSEAEEDEQDELKPPDLSCNSSYKRSPAQRSSARLNRHRIPQSALRDSLEDAGPTRRGLNRTKKARKRKRPKNALCTTTQKQAKSHADEELQTELFPPSKSLKSAVWKHFGYRKNAKGIVEEDGFPVCKLCLRTVTAKGGNTTNMLAHLKVHHRSVYEEIKPVKILEQPPVKLENEDFESELFPPSKSLKSAVWKHFGYRKNVKGFVEEDGFPVCKLCRGKIAARRGNTTNMLAHLKVHHYSVFAEIKKVKVEVVTEPPKKRSKQLKAAVWRYFGYPVNMGCVTEDGLLACQICNQTVDTRRGCTAVMLQHLCLHHSTEYTEIKDEFVGMWPSLEKEIKPSELYPPNKCLKSAVWEHFGYLKNDEGLLEEDGQPICKLCLRKVMSVGTTSNMRKHLQDHHPFSYAETEPEVHPVVEVVVPSELYLPNKPLSSAIWEHFGYMKNSEGIVEENGFPICKLCFHKVPSKRGNTSKMFEHLKKHHESVYAEIKTEISNVNPSEIHSPGIGFKSAVWEYFGYLKNADGELEQDGYPICKFCFQKVASKGGTTSNMHKHLKKYHPSVHEAIEKAVNPSSPVIETEEEDHPLKLQSTAVPTLEEEGDNQIESHTEEDFKTELFPPSKSLKSAVWKHFGYRKNAKGVVEEDGFPVCKLCLRTVAAKGGNTTNMLAHLHVHHHCVYEEIKPVKILEQPPVKLENEDFESELFPPSKSLKSAVWKYFGYRKNVKGFVEEDGFPVCKLCRGKIAARRGNTTNMLAHLKARHYSLYAEIKKVKVAVVTKPIKKNSKQLRAAVWRYFGYPVNMGCVTKDGHPTCQICNQTVDTRRGCTAVMLQHLCLHHSTEYTEIKNEFIRMWPSLEKEIKPSELYPPNKGLKSAVWEHFGYLKNDEGLLEEDGQPLCKLCLRKVMSVGTTSNMRKHLQDHHPFAYAELQTEISDVNPSEIHSPGPGLKSAVWEYFGYLKNADGELEQDGYPICKFCFQKVASKGGTTSNMHKHLKKYHPSVHEAIEKAVNPSSPVIETEEEDHPLKLQSTAVPTLEEEGDNQVESHTEEDFKTELFPPSKSLNSAVWKHFGYRKNAKGIVEEDGFPVCKLCLRTVAAKGGNTSNMLAHLHVHHHCVYEEIKKVKVAVVTKPPKKNSKQLKAAVWRYFGQPINMGCVTEDGHLTCQICNQTVDTRRGDTSVMLQHLCLHHSTEYKEIKDEFIGTLPGLEKEIKPSELYPPNKGLKSAVWEHFGYLKNAEGLLEEDGKPICKLCLRKVVSVGTTSNMRKHLQDHHPFSYAETEREISNVNPSEIHSPGIGFKSAVWEHFGYLKNADGELEQDGYPICKFCFQKVASKGGTTSNMHKHLKKYHPSVHAAIEKAVNPSSPVIETEEEDHPLELQSTAVPTLEEEGDNTPDLYPPKKRAKSAVWEHFGYLKDADGIVKEDDYPICKICFKKVASKGSNTSNMLNHLLVHHQPVFDEMKKTKNPLDPVRMTMTAAVSTLEEERDKPLDLYPPKKRARSAAWEHFGYLKNAEGIVREDDFPICKICFKKVASKGGSTSNMLKHLWVHHQSIFDEIKTGVAT